MKKIVFLQAVIFFPYLKIWLIFLTSSKYFFICKIQIFLMHTELFFNKIKSL